MRESEDGFIADFAVGTGAGQIKSGSLRRSGGIARHRCIPAIDKEPGTKARFGGPKVKGKRRRPLPPGVAGDQGLSWPLAGALSTAVKKRRGILSPTLIVSLRLPARMRAGSSFAFFP